MLDWYVELYTGKSIEKKDVHKIIHKINRGKAVPGIYLLTLSQHPDNVLEILPALNLAQKAARRRCPRIIGMALGKEEALEVTQEILLETYGETGTFHVREYLQDR